MDMDETQMTAAPVATLERPLDPEQLNRIHAW
jgi:hypothetical protein